MSLHTFDPKIAAEVGLNAAVIYQNILFWTRKNLANGRHVHDDMVWTYNSVKALNELFDYMTPDQVRRALAKLVKVGLIAEGNFNQSAYDRTKWYGVPCQIHLAKTTNGVGENHKPIPDSKPDGKPVTLAQPEADASATIDRSRFADFWAMVPRKIGKKATEAAWKRLSRADQDAAKDSVAAWYRWFQSTHRDATPLYPERYLKHRRWEDEGWQDKPKAAPDRDAAIAMHRKALTSPSEAVRRNAQDQLRKLGETI